MKNWEETKWGEVATLEYGKALRDYDEEDGTYPVFGTNGQIGWHEEPLVNRPGVIIGRKGAYRGVEYSDKPFCVIDTAFYLNLTTDKILDKWAYYQLKDFDINNIDSGTAIPSTSREAFYQIPVEIPPIEEQKKIVENLSTFDDLIENNTRRIEILEEMARRIYREWFVHFRYPGHQDDELVDSGTDLGEIPEGWEVKKLLDVCNLQTGKALKSKQFNEDGDGVKAVRIRNVRTNSSETYTDEDFDDKYLIENGDILVGMDGDFHMCRWADGKSVLVQRVARFRPKEEVGLSKYFFYWAIKKPIDYFNKTITGTTVAHLGKKHIKTIEIVLPPKDLRYRINKILDSMYEVEILLRRQNKKLKETRDLLLPKLISGEIEYV